MDCSTRARRNTIAIIAIAASAFMLNGCNSPIPIHAYRVSSQSMLPLLGSGDRIFADESDDARSNLHDGDVVVLRHRDTLVIKRILAMQGETISIDHRTVLRDGKQLDEPYLAPAKDEEIAGLTTLPPRKIPAGEIFVMGDNRDRSLDSRFSEYGPVYRSDVVGKYMWAYWRAK